MARFTVLLYPSEEGGFAALVPLLDVATQGDTVEHALNMAHEAAELRIRSLVRDGEPVLAEDQAPIVAAIDVTVPIEVTV
jgi:predicted RNase H-like HicB family nuclease